MQSCSHGTLSGASNSLLRITAVNFRAYGQNEKVIAHHRCVRYERTSGVRAKGEAMNARKWLFLIEHTFGSISSAPGGYATAALGNSSVSARAFLCFDIKPAQAAWIAGQRDL
jgi:hypothetical protein